MDLRFFAAYIKYPDNGRLGQDAGLRGLFRLPWCVGTRQAESFLFDFGIIKVYTEDKIRWLKKKNVFTRTVKMKEDDYIKERDIQEDDWIKE